MSGPLPLGVCTYGCSRHFFWGYSYFSVRGEILGSLEDELRRKHLPRMFSLIKNES
uniref:Uncharacterized protein n=1 Tax=Hyaloperonospora arabidopsidis (strain Emoy2) TaxID=559515 RepID=M4C565_HYAAE